MNGYKDRPKQDTYGFKTCRNAPQSKELLNFESDLNHLVANLEFNENISNFQRKLSNDVRKINNSKNLFIEADKTNNFYEVDKKDYKKLLRDTITNNYKIDESKIEDEINISAKKITDQLGISDRVETIALKDAYITIKDHKPKFPEKISCRLINPTKTNIGIISKQILEKINKNLICRLNLRQLKNTHQTIVWFNGLKNKTRQQFFQFDIVDFYPSVTEKLLRSRYHNECKKVYIGE